MSEPQPPTPGRMPEDGIFRAILMVLVASVVVGAGVALAGELLWHNEAISHAGAWMALVCGGLYFFFRLLGRREMRKRAERDGRDPDDLP